MDNSIIRILLIADYSILRSALRMLVETSDRLRVVGEASETEDALAIIERERPDVILVDLPDFGGNDLFPFLQRTALTIPVLILAGQHETGVYEKCLKLGISGLVTKDKNADLLHRAIQRVHEGELWFDRITMGKTILQMVNEKQMLLDNPRPNATNGMTDREKQVVELIAKGLKNKAIAEKLFITETTVRHHLTSIFNKLKVTTRLELVIYAFKHGFVQPPSNDDKDPESNGRATGFRYV